MRSCGARGAHVGRGCRLASANGPSLPEVVPDAARSEDASEGHLDAVTYADRGGIDVGELAEESSPAIEVDRDRDDGRAQRIRQAIDRERGDGAFDVRQSLRCHLVDRGAANAGSL